MIQKRKFFDKKKKKLKEDKKITERILVVFEEAEWGAQNSVEMKIEKDG